MFGSSSTTRIRRCTAQFYSAKSWFGSFFIKNSSMRRGLGAPAGGRGSGRLCYAGQAVSAEPPNPQPLNPHPRADGRSQGELRPVSLEPRYLELHPASCMARFGRTWVLCTASVEERLPPFLEGQGRGWVTGNYGMMPGSVRERVPPARNSGGRAEEISRLIGRSLRAAVDLAGVGLRTITMDCQVVQADGGTRTAAVTGGYLALSLA